MALLGGRLGGRGIGAPVNVREYGATGGGVRDDSAAIQAAIDAVAAAGGGDVIVPPGEYRANVTLASGVFLRGPGRGYLPDSTQLYIATIRAAGAGVVIDTPAASSRNLGVIGVNVQGLGADVPVVGIRFRGVIKGYIKDCNVDDTADEGILLSADSGGCTIEDVQITNALLDRTRAAIAGALDIDGTDHWLKDIEATASVAQGTVTDANLYCAAMAIRMANGQCIGLMAEISDVGVYLTGTQNRLTNCRADLNGGHGWVVSGTRNQIANSLALNNGQAATNTYDGWRFDTAGLWNQTANCRAESQTGITAKHAYGFNDLTASATQRNTHDGPVSFGAATAQFKNGTASGAAFFFPRGSYRDLTVNSATPDVTGYTYFRTANTQATTITNFTGGVDGQEIVVFCNDLLTTVDHNGSTISLSGAADQPLTRLSHYRFIRSGGMWRNA